MDLNINMCVCTLWGKSKKNFTTPSRFNSHLCCHGGVCHIHISIVEITSCVTHQETLEHKDRFAWSLG